MTKKNLFPDDHKKVKGRLKAPMNYLFQQYGFEAVYKPIDFDREVIPEILWLHYLNKGVGEVLASEVMAELITRANKLATKKDKTITGFISSFGILNQEERSILVSELSVQTLEILNLCLFDLKCLFPKLPVSFLLNEVNYYEVGALGKLKSSLDVLYERNSKDMTFAISHVVYPLIMNKVLQISSEVLIHPKYLADYPQTEESQKVAATLRNFIRILVQKETNTQKEWIRYFWERCFLLEPCKLQINE